MQTGISEGQPENQHKVGEKMYRKPSLDHSYNHKDETELSEVQSNSEGEEEEEKKQS